MPLSQLPDILLILVELLPFEDASSLATASQATLRNLESANRILSSAVKGMELLGWRPFRGALYQQIQESMLPHPLVNETCCQCHPASCTVPMPLALDSSGRYFVMFLFWCRCTSENCCPTMGVVDAAAMRKDPNTKLNEDMSRPRKPSRAFGISCDPYTGKIYASRISDLFEDAPGELPEQGTSSQKNWSADVIGWESCDPAAVDPEAFSRGMGMLTGMGMIIDNGTLEFVRQGRERFERSGVVWDRLPAKVACCAFLQNFAGQAFVSLQEVRVNELPRCTQLPSTFCGKMSSWTAWPPSETIQLN